MVTISELKWFKIEHGKCPCCGRDRPLGRLNTDWYDEEDEAIGDRCIDCFFGPPQEYWCFCEKCREQYVGEKCDSGGYDKDEPICKAENLGASKKLSGGLP